MIWQSFTFQIEIIKIPFYVNHNFNELLASFHSKTLNHQTVATDTNKYGLLVSLKERAFQCCRIINSLYLFVQHNCQFANSWYFRLLNIYDFPREIRERTMVIRRQVVTDSPDATHESHFSACRYNSRVSGNDLATATPPRGSSYVVKNNSSSFHRFCSFVQIWTS